MVIADIDFGEYFTPEQIAEYKVMFSKYAQGGEDSSIGVEELFMLFLKMGLKLNRPQLETVVAEVDADGNGLIEFEEFLVLMIKILGSRPRADLINYKEWCDSKTLQNIKTIFRKYDTSGDGSIGYVELNQVFQDMGLKLSLPQVEEICREVDKDGSGEIEFDEFAAMWVVLARRNKILNPREYMTGAEITQNYKVFKTFDGSGDGTIDTSELDSLFRRLGLVLKKEQLAAMIKQFDADGSGEIDFDEFCTMMIKLKGMKRSRRLVTENSSVPALWSEGFSVREIKRVGFDARAMREARIPAVHLFKKNVDGGNIFSPLEMRAAGYAAGELRKAGVGASQLRYCGYSTHDLRAVGFSHQALREANRKLNTAMSAGDLSLLPQTHPQKPFDPKCRLPYHMTPRIRQNTEYQMKTSGPKVASVGMTLMAASRLKKLRSGKSEESRKSLTAAGGMIAGAAKVDVGEIRDTGKEVKFA